MRMPLNHFVESWYGKTIPEVLDAFDLLDFGHAGIPASVSKACPLLSSRRVIGATENLARLFEKNSVISGGPCIDDCHYDISLESVYEIASLIKVGKELQKKVIIHIGVQEEILRKKQSAGSIQKWKKIGKRFEGLIGELSKAMGYQNVLCCRSDDEELDKEISRLAGEIQKSITWEDARTLYRHLCAPQAAAKDSFNFGIHARFLALYLPEFVELALKSGNARLLVYEDIQQLMAVKKARALATLRNRFNSGPAQIITLPYPSIDGKIRMHRSDRKFRPYLHSLPESLHALVRRMPEKVFEFNRLTWPAELAGKAVSTRGELADFFVRLKEYDACD